MGLIIEEYFVRLIEAYFVQLLESYFVGLGISRIGKNKRFHIG